jgi:hypothetical protein
MICPNLFVKGCTFILWHFVFFLLPLQLYRHHGITLSATLTYNTNKIIIINTKLPSPKMVKVFILHKNSCNSLKMWQCETKHSNLPVMTSFVFWCENLHNYEKLVFHHILQFFKEKVTRLKKNWKSYYDISLLVCLIFLMFR